MTEPLKIFVENHGLLIEAEGNAPILLSGQEKVWLIDSGRIDIFSVVLQDGRPLGKRNYLFRVKSGEVIFGSASINMGMGIGLLAVGMLGTRLIEMPMSILREKAKDPHYQMEAALWIEKWVTKLSTGVRKDLPPKTFLQLEPGHEIELDVDHYARPSSGMIWVRHLKGGFRFLSGETLINPEADKDYLFPIYADGWIKIVEKSRLFAADTLYFLEQDPLWSGLESFYRLILQIAQLNEKEERDQTLNRLHKKSAEETLTAEAAIFQLTSLLSKKKDRILLDRIPSEPLLAACRFVGEAAGIHIANIPESIEGRQMSKERLEEISYTAGFRTRQVVLRNNWWKRDNGPLLGHLEDSGQPVALLPVSPNHYELVNPAVGSRLLMDAQSAATISPFAYSFYRPFPSRPLSVFDLVKFGLVGNRKDLISAMMTGILGGILALMLPIITGVIFDTAIPEGDRFQLLHFLAALMIASLSITVFQITRNITVIGIQSRMNSLTQAAVIDRLLNMPISFFHKFTAGDLTLRSIGINTIRQELSGIVFTSIANTIFSFFYLALLFFYNVVLATIAVGLALIGLLFTLVIAVWDIRYEREITDCSGKLSGIVLQFITSIAKLRVAAVEVHAFGTWTVNFVRKKRASLHAGILKNYQAVFNSMFPLICTMAIFSATAFLIEKSVAAGEVPLSTGQFITFIVAFSVFLSSMLDTGLKLISVLNIIPLYERSQPILRESPEIEPGKNDPGELRGEIEISHVNFRYDNDGPLVLRDISLHILPGEFVAVVGASGSGKSTLMRLLIGFEHPEGGSIYYNEQNLADLDIRAVRRQVGVVLQSSRLMSGTIFMNIIGSSNLTLNDAWEAARMAGFDKDIEEMPMQMHTIVSEGGSTLSGGQRQRLLIARALIKKPRIIFFDEATSALDNPTQRVVSHSLENLQATRVVIAHRLSTVMNANRIYVMQAGQVVESGSFEQLMERKGIFAELAKRQMA